MWLASFLATVLTVSSPQALRMAIDDLGSTGGTIELQGDNWHFKNADARELSFFISNHDQSKAHRVNLPIIGVTNLTIKGTGQTLTFENPSIGIYIHNSKNIEFKDVKLDWQAPYLTDAKILGFEPKATIVEAPRMPAAIGETMLFDGKTHNIVPRTADIVVPKPFTHLSNNVYRIAKDFSKIGAGGKVGDVICLRPNNRRFPAVVVDHAKDVTLVDFVIHSAGGMGLIAQMSENIAWYSDSSNLKAGVYPPEGSARVTTLHADASHFSNCKGLINIQRCRFETMMDDALNVHSTSLGITERLDDHRIKVKFMHRQAYGFELFHVGDVVRLIKGKTLENGAELELKAVERLNDRELILTFAAAIPAEYGVGDAVENASYQPEVFFAENYVARNRARGILITTPQKVAIYRNIFDSVSGTAILFAGDAQGWYESGACENVLIEKNTFRNCMTSRFQFCEAVITSYPMVKDLKNQTKSYHRGIVVRDNVFEKNAAPPWFMISTEPPRWDGNTHADGSPISR